MPRRRGGRWPGDPSRYRWVVDGHNAIFTHPELARLQKSDQRAEARRRLAQLLERFAVEYATDVTVVFDSGGGPRGGSLATGSGSRIILYSLPGEEADDRIVRLVEQMQRDHEAVVVVSSDRSTLGARLSADVLRVEPAELFRRLGARRRQRRGGAAGDKPTERPAGDFRDIEEHFLSIDDEAEKRRHEREDEGQQG